jgi:hypothetical protein
MTLRKRTTSIRLLQQNPKLLIVVSLLVLVLIGATLELTGTTHFFHKTNLPAVISTMPGGPSSDSSSSSKSKVSAKIDSQKNPSSSQTSNKLPLYAPYGVFVSNHSPNLSGHPAPSSETSVCNTTPGAQCYIELTNGSLSTKLPAKVADGSGSVYWYWDVAKNNLTPGDWKITVIATLNNQSKSTQDTMSLRVRE